MIFENNKMKEKNKKCADIFFLNYSFKKKKTMFRYQTEKVYFEGEFWNEILFNDPKKESKSFTCLEYIEIDGN